jgi:exonuclease SbcD
MKIFHTSDWHIGRSFHGHPTLEFIAPVFDAMVQLVTDNSVDVVVVAGDIFDSGMPSAEAVKTLERAIRDLKAAGAAIIMTSGNHDSATRLGFQSQWARLADIHMLTGHESYLEPVIIADEHGPVHFYGVPYLEPALVRHHYPNVELRTHTQVLDHAMQRVRADLADRGGRTVAISHSFVADVAAPSTNGEATDVERDITAGGLDLVPASTFDGPDYVALGHIHGRNTITERVRYSGAPMHYSFAEAGKPRGGWLVNLDASGLAAVDWADLPIPRRLTVLTGTIAELLDTAAHTPHEQDWVSAIVTDQVRPMDGMRRLQTRFPNAVALEHRPKREEREQKTYASRVNQKTDREIVGGFLEHVRNGVGPNDYESALIDELLTAAEAEK